MNIKLHIIPAELTGLFKAQVDDYVTQNFEDLQDSELSMNAFSFYTSVSAVFSSKIEGEDIELDSYVKHKRFRAHFLPDYTRKIDDLYEAYQYAQQNKLTEQAFLKAHKLLTSHILQKGKQGKYRVGNMFVISDGGKIEYVATTPGKVKTEMKTLWADIGILLNEELGFKEVLFFAAMIRLVFVKIHPFEDGNGRMGRLLEKWFMGEKLGAKAWLLQSERYYYTHHEAYYNNIRKLGLEYDMLDYTQALSFLQMLPDALK